MCHFQPRSERIPKRICMIWCCPWFTACSLANEFWYTAVVARDAPWHFKSRFESCPCLVSETMNFFCWLLLQNSLMSWNCNFRIVLSECSSCSKKFLLWSNHFCSSWHLPGTGTLVAALLMTSAGGHQSLCSAIASMRAVRPGMLKNPLQQLYLLHLRNCLLQIWCWRPPNRRLTYCKTQWEEESPKQSEARLLGGSTHLPD